MNNHGSHKMQAESGHVETRSSACICHWAANRLLNVIKEPKLAQTKVREMFLRAKVRGNVSSSLGQGNVFFFSVSVLILFVRH